MPIGERFRQSENQDPRITRLETVKRNFERTGYYGDGKFIIGLGYFGMLKELLKLFPEADIIGKGTDRSTIPGLRWPFSRGLITSLELFGLNVTTSNLLVMTRDLHMTSDLNSSYFTIKAKEIVPEDELNKDVLEDAILRVLSVSGFSPDEQDQKKAKRHSQDEDSDSSYRYHRALKLDPMPSGIYQKKKKMNC